MGKWLAIIVAWGCVLCVKAQPQQVFAPNIRTLQLVVDNNPLLPPMLDISKHQHLCISWDEMSHQYHRYIYHLQHCQHDWTPSDGIFESDCLATTLNGPYVSKTGGSRIVSVVDIWLQR